MTHDREPSCSNDIDADRLAAVDDTFEQAWSRGPRSKADYVLTGQPARLRVAGATLARYVSAPFAHLRAPEPAPPPDLTIDLWDARETGVVGPMQATPHGSGQRWTLDDGALAVSADGTIVRHTTRNGIVWLDRRAHRIAGWVTDARELPLYERARPLQVLLALCANDREVHALHGACVARDDRGVVLAGDSGTGKSTASLCCLEAGWTYLGDDWIGIGRSADGATVAHGLYGSLALEPEHVARFPRLRAHGISPRNGIDLKTLILLPDVFPGQLGRRATVAVLALPRLVDSRDTRIRPATKRDALLTMARSAICTMRPRGGRAAVRAFTELAQDCPAFWLEIGSDLRQIPPRIDELLQAARP